MKILFILIAQCFGAHLLYFTCKEKGSLSFTLVLVSFSFWLHCEACGAFVPQPGMEPVPPALAVWSLNHWATREVP